MSLYHFWLKKNNQEKILKHSVKNENKNISKVMSSQCTQNLSIVFIHKKEIISNQ